jgi:hypothetical protein
MALRDVDQKRLISLQEKISLNPEQVQKLTHAIIDVRERGEQWDWMRGAPAAGDKFTSWSMSVLGNIKVRLHASGAVDCVRF